MRFFQSFKTTVAVGIATGLLLIGNGTAGQAFADDSQQGPPPALVVTAKSTSGHVAQQADYVGTIYFPEVAEVASEVNGRVESVAFDEGDTVKAGQVLVRLSTDLLLKDIASSSASLEKAEADLQKADLDYKRISELFDADTVSEQQYDDARLSRLGSQKNVQALRASLERLKLQVEKAVVRVPFNGVVLDRKASRGEWLGAGSVVGTIARNDYVEAVVEVPESQLAWVKKGESVPVRVAGREVEGRVVAAILKGDTATRTFPVKVRVDDVAGLAQGMEARVSLPKGEATESVLVQRDAVVHQHGMDVVWIAADGKAQMMPVQVIAFQGMEAAVRGQGLVPGMDVVIKGNERLRPGQPVMPAPGQKQ